VWSESIARCFGSGLDALRFFQIGLFEALESFAETVSILLGDGKDAVTALGATLAADEVGATALRGREQGGVYDLD
jgi:hypothetical protein